MWFANRTYLKRLGFNLRFSMVRPSGVRITPWDPHRHLTPGFKDNFHKIVLWNPDRTEHTFCFQRYLRKSNWNINTSPGPSLETTESEWNEI